jgi:hypothetical protein
VDVSIGEIVATLTAVAGAGATWGMFNHKVKAIAETIERTRTDQGRRIGVLEDQIAELRGYVMGARYRKKTKPHGEPTT